ncbi:MAG: 4Fe-4S binding protein [Bacillota bacterium]
MARVKRKIIRIEEDKCDGCGLCIPGCPEGALQVVNGKARLVRESFCDGLGACVGECPNGALKVEEREAEDYDFDGVVKHLSEKSPELLEKHLRHLKEHGVEPPRTGMSPGETACTKASVLSENAGPLRQWPVKLYLIPPTAPFLKDADLVLVADCVPFACTNLHGGFLEGKAFAAGCPKFDDTVTYKDKIEQMIKQSGVRSLKVLHMEVPCCSGLVYIAREALARTGAAIPLESVVIGIKGETKSARLLNGKAS